MSDIVLGLITIAPWLALIIYSQVRRFRTVSKALDELAALVKTVPYGEVDVMRRMLHNFCSKHWENFCWHPRLSAKAAVLLTYLSERIEAEGEWNRIVPECRRRYQTKWQRHAAKSFARFMAGQRDKRRRE